MNRHAVGGNDVMNDNKPNGVKHDQNGRVLKSWPWGAQFIFALFALLFIGFLWVGLPVISTLKFGGNVPVNESGLWEPMVASMLGITTMTITAIFLFMTFRIDRGTKREAREEARETAVEKTKEIVKNAAKYAAKDATTAAKKAVEGAETAAKAATAHAEAAAKEIKARLEREIRERDETIETKVRDSIEAAIATQVNDESLKRMFRKVLVESFSAEERKALHVQTVTEWTQSMSPEERNAVRDLLKELTATLKQSRKRRWFGR